MEIGENGPMRLDRARRIVDHVVAAAPAPLSVFVADSHGELVAAATMDGAAPDTRLNAQRKAYTAARSDARSTRELRPLLHVLPRRPRRLRGRAPRRCGRRQRPSRRRRRAAGAGRDRRHRVSDAARQRAREELAAGAARAPARAHFRAMGIDPARLDGPIVGVVSTWTGTMPCNLNQRELADRVVAGVTAAGGVGLAFNTIAVSDNQSQGTPGMRASLVSREVIADSIELMTAAHDFDALVCIVGCDKTVPAALMALARVDKPAVVLYSGPMRAGRLDGREVTIQDVWEAIGGPRAALDELERVACHGPGTC